MPIQTNAARSARPVVHLPPLLLVALLLASTLPGAAGATTVVHLPLPKLTRVSDVIVDATVQRTSCRLVDRRLFTFVTVRVKAWHKGAPRKRPQALVVRVPGGRLGQRWLTVAGMPRFAAGERVLLFLLRRPGFHWTLGLQQGKFSITTDAAGREVATRKFRGLEFLGISGSPPRVVPLARLLARVRSALTPAPGRRP